MKTYLIRCETTSLIEAENEREAYRNFKESHNIIIGFKPNFMKIVESSVDVKEIN